MPSFALIMTGLRTISMKSANILMRWWWKEQELIFENCKANDRTSPPQTALRVGAELHSPRDIFLGLALRFKSVLRNSGRICLTAVRKETSLPLLIHHQNREMLMMINFLKFTGFGPPPWRGGSTLRVELRDKTRRQAMLKRRKSFLNFIVIIIIRMKW